jgi:hypothetical protein
MSVKAKNAAFDAAFDARCFGFAERYRGVFCIVPQRVPRRIASSVSGDLRSSRAPILAYNFCMKRLIFLAIRVIFLFLDI